MIPVTQTKLHDPTNNVKGNCLSATLAALLHLDIDEIPLFESDGWVERLNQFLKPMNLAFILIQPHSLEYFGVSDCWHEMGGASPRFSDAMHSVVGKDATIVFDPHPDRTGLNGVESIGVFIALEPWRAKSI